jgi:Rieske Fe-S protein
LRGGAKHPIYEPSAALREGSVMRIPMTELQSLGAPAVLEVRPGQGEPELLVTQESDGAWRVVSAHCPHKGCIVDWDGSGRKWACPCHGSEFAPDGALLQGPAKEGLKHFSAVVEKDASGAELLAIDLSKPS